jgi:hypothetical protein
MAKYFDETQYKGSYDDSVLQYLEGAIESWECEKNIECEDAEVRDMAQRFAQLLLKSCYTVKDIDELQKVFKELGITISTLKECDSPSWIDYGEHELAKESIGMLAIASDRIWRLFATLFIIKDLDINDRVLKYLKRVFRCYVWGFDPECIIMCRGVVEKTIEDIVTFDMCMEMLGERKGQDKDRWYTLQDRLCIAKKKNYITDEMETLIYAIKEKGNKAVHHATWLIEDMLITIKDTCKILAVLTKER